MQLHYQTLGVGHPLIILHGLFGSLANWKSLGRLFSESHQVFLLDQRNHGRSPHHDNFNYAVMAEDIKEFIEQQQLPSAHLLGHSMGGKTAMQFALNYPELVDKLIVVDIAPKDYPPHHDEIIDALHSVEIGSLKSRQELDEKLAQKISDNDVRQFLMMNAMPDANGQLRWRMNLEAIDNNYAQISKGLETQRSFTRPTLFIRGETSDYIQPEDLPLIETLFPQAQVVTIAGAGHWVHAEAGDEFARVVLEFLKH